MSKPNHISHWIDSNITTQEFIDLIRQDQNKNHSPTTASKVLTEISTKMTDMLLDSEPDNDNLSGMGLSSELPRFDLPWTNGHGTVVDSYEHNLNLPVTLNGLSKLTSYNARSLKHVVCAGVGRKRLEFINKSKAGKFK